MVEQTENLDDETREREIASVFSAMQAATCTSAERRLLFAQVRGLIAGRSAEQIARMEAEKGLRPKAA